MTTSSETGRTGDLLGMQTPPIVSAEEWKAAWEELHEKEKAHSRARDALAAECRRMPWRAVEKDYAFGGPSGLVSLLDLFDGRRQLIVYRAFMDPGIGRWPERGCIGCSMVADHPEWDADERAFAVAWRNQPKWVVSRSLKSVGPNARLVEDDLEGRTTN